MKWLLLFSPFAIVEEGLVSLLLLIDSKVYGLFATLYNLYLELAMARIFDIDAFKSTISNIYVIFGVVALFIVAFSLLQSMVNPDNISNSTKATKDVVKRLLLCIGGIILVPFMFDFLYDVQYSILAYQVIPKAIVGVEDASVSGVINYTDADGNTGSIDVGKIDESDVAKAGLELYGNTAAYYVLSGFLHANDVDGDGVNDDVIVDASEYFDTSTGLLAGGLGCLISVAVTGALAISGFGIPAAATTSLGTAAICTAGIAGGVIINGVLETITSEEFSWNFVSVHFIQQLGNFDFISAFSSAVVSGDMSYTPILSTIAGLILVYMIFSFCLDLGIRAAKLTFYQIMAPISFLLSIIPKNKDLMTNWFKVTLTTWAEVFVRIFLLCLTTLLISNIKYSNLSDFGFVARAIIVLGLVAFAKQLPKLLSEITGIKSGDMKLGIKDKLAAGGAFALGGVVGGALTGGIRNAANAVANGRNNWKGASLREKAGLVARGVGSTIAGTTSGAYHSGRAGLNAKNFKDMKNASSKGGMTAVSNREGRTARNDRYKANGNFFTQSSVGGHILDAYEDVKDFVTGGASKYGDIISTGEKFNNQWSKVKNTAGDLKKKKLNDNNVFFDEHIASKMSDSYFKGSNSGEMKSLFERLVSDGSIRNMRELEEYYTSLNNKQIDSSSFARYDDVAYEAAKEMARKSVDRKQFEKNSGVLDSSGNPIVKFDEEAYKKAKEIAEKSVSREQFRSGIDQTAYEKAQRKLNTEKSLVASMIAQIDKKSTEEVIDLTREEALSYGFGNSDYLELQAEKDVFGEMFKSAGGNVTHVSIENGVEKSSVIKDVTSASNMKDAAEAYKDLASKASGEAKRIEIKKEARKKEDKK